MGAVAYFSSHLKSLWKDVAFVYNGFLCNVNSSKRLHYIWWRWHLLYAFQFAHNVNPAI